MKKIKDSKPNQSGTLKSLGGEMTTIPFMTYCHRDPMVSYEMMQVFTVFMFPPLTYGFQTSSSTTSESIISCYHQYFSASTQLFTFHSLPRLTIWNCQCWRELRGDPGYQSHSVSRWTGWVETPGHLPQLLWDGCRVFPLWWADLCYEVWQLDLRWLPGGKMNIEKE